MSQPSAEDTRRNDSETMCAVVLLTKSPSWVFSYCLLDSVVAAVFLCDGRWRRSRRVGRGLFAARRAREVLVVGFTRLLANRGLIRRQRRRLRVLFRALPAELDLEFPVVVRAD